MNHLTDEQFEDCLQGSDAGDLHLDDCADCRERLAEKKALAGLVRGAFMSVKAGEELVGRVREGAGQRRRLWPALVAAAAVFMVLIPAGLYVMAPSAVLAAQAELVMIHQQNMGEHREFYSDADVGKLAEYFMDKLGFSPAFPCTGQGLEIRGCCVAQFNGKIAGSYVVDTPRGIISMIIVSETPWEMGMSRFGDVYWKSSYAQNNMVAADIGGYSYCAVGDVSELSCEYLAELLGRLLPNP